MPEAIAEAPPAQVPVTAPVQQAPVSMSFVDKVRQAADSEPKKPAEAPKEEAKKVEVPKVEVKPPTETKKADVKMEEKKPVAEDAPLDWKTAPKHLRSAYEKAQAELKELKSKPAPKVDEAPEFKTLNEKFAQREKEYAELKKQHEEIEQALRYTDYEKSAEFQTKYQKPWVDTYQEGLKEVTGLSVPLDDGTTRKATKKEFDAIVTNPDTDAAIDMAGKLFNHPTREGVILRYREKFLAANKAMEDAKQEYRDKGVEIEKQTAAQRDEAFQQETALWQKSNREWVDKNPQWAKAEDGDDEGSKKLELGNKAADMAFGDTSKLDPEKRAKLFSDTRNRAAAFGYVTHKLEKATARITELESKLKEFEESEPGKGEIKKDIGGAPVEKTFAQKLAEAAR
jgi:hypothetical protein